MSSASTQPSQAHLEREYPHQVVVLTETLRGRILDGVVNFHSSLGIPTKSYSIRKDDALYTLYHFAEADHAKLFKIIFGGHSGAIDELAIQGVGEIKHPKAPGAARAIDGRF